MSKFSGISSMADVSKLDKSEMMNGYWVGYFNQATPINTTSPSFWHGWRTGRVDAGFEPMDEAQRKIMAEFHFQQSVTLH